MARPRSPVMERFLSKIEVAPNGCWIWQGTKGYLGRGLFWFDGRPVAAHRFAYLVWVGEIPEGLVLDHYVCDNGGGGCVNPDHMRPVTQRENVLRGDTIVATNVAKEECLRGHPFSVENTYWYKGHRHCRKCRQERDRVWRR